MSESRWCDGQGGAFDSRSDLKQKGNCSHAAIPARFPARPASRADALGPIHAAPDAVVPGAVRDLGRPARTARGWLAPAREGDLATPGRCAPSTAWPWRWTARREPPLVPLRVDPANLSGLARLAGDTPRWRAQPGVPLAVLAQAGLRQFDGLPGAMTLAEWLAAPAAPAGRCAQSGSWRPTWCWPTGWRKPWGLWRERRTVAALGHVAAAGAGAVPTEHGAGRRRPPWAAPGPVVTGWTRCGLRRPPRSTWRICCWGTAARWPGCRRCCSAVPAAEGREAARRRRWTVRRGRRDAGSTPGSRRCSTRMVVFLTRFFAIATVRGPRVRWLARRRGTADGAARARSHIAPAAVGIEFLPFLY